MLSMFYPENLKGLHNFRDEGVDTRMILKWILNKDMSG
jgi:hypothetical protein